MAYAKYGKRPYQKPAPIARVKSTRTPSPMQQAILDFVRTGQGNLLIQARAGTGKSSTLEMICDAIQSGLPQMSQDAGSSIIKTVRPGAGSSVVLLAFNKSIAEELKARGLPASTFHSLGYGAVRKALAGRNAGAKINLDANKVGNIFDNLYGQPAVDARSAVLRVVSLLKNSATLPNDVNVDTVNSIVDHFDIDLDKRTVQEIADMARAVLTANNADTLTIDFDDMLYFVVVFNAHLDTYDYVLVDENQDTNEIQREILRRVLGPRSRLIAVGDSAQAIYGFRGASHDSTDLIRTEFHCTELPLSVSYRCPASVIELAQRFVPDIMARDNAPTGTVLYPERWKLTDFRPDDLLICRNTAPLVQAAYKMIARRIPCKIMGREIGRGLVLLIQKVAGKRGTLDTLPERLEQYRSRETEKMMARRQEGRLQALNDKVDSILALLDTMSQDDIELGIQGLCAIIESMFSDNGPRVTTLATIHKSKGMEAPRVFILDAHLMPSKYAKQEWQIVQEHNLHYVAITRSLDTLVYLDSDKLSD